MVKQSSYQYVWQSVSLAEQPDDEHTKIREPSILSHSRKKKQSFMPVNFRGWNVLGGGLGVGVEGGHRLKIRTVQPWIYFFSPFFNPFMFVLHHCFPHSLPVKKNTNTDIWKSSRLYEKSCGLSYWNEVQLLRPLKDLMQNWLFHRRGPCCLCSHRAGMLDSGTTTKATIYQLWLHTFWSIAPLNC